MAQQTPVAWDDLPEPTKDVFRWAQAAELGPDVGSRGLLTGLLRTPNANEAQILLAHFGVLPGEVFDRLRKRDSKGHRLDPLAKVPASLHELPPLTPNTARILDRATELQREVHTESIDPSCVLGALLDTERATASQVLAGLIGPAPFPRLRDSYFDWLRANGLSWAQTLERDFPGSAAHDTTPTAPATTAVPDGWRFAFALPGSADEPPGIGFLIGPGVLAVPGTSAATEAVAIDGRRHALSPLSGDGRTSIMQMAPVPDADPLTGAAPTSGQRCTVAVTDYVAGGMALVEGRVRTHTGTGEFVVELDDAPRKDEVAVGSPVVVGDSLVGIVEARTTDRSLAAFETRLVPRSEATTGTLSGAANDAVGDVDQLRFEPYVTAFADLISSPHTKPPLTIGIFGSWGSGKSFLLEHIERTIDARQMADPGALPRVHVVRFNAWEYSATEVVWPGLVRKIVTRLDELTTWPRHKRIRTRVRWNLARQWSGLRVQLVSAALVFAVALAVALANGKPTLAGAIVAIGAVLGAGGLVKAAKDPIAQWVTALFSDSDYGRQLGVMEDIKHDLEQLEGRLHRLDADGNDVVTGRILVLIDDLDRCEPAKAVEVMQAVNLLLNFSSFVVCLGIDARIVTAAIEKHYEGLLGAAGASGYEYLDKIVQIPFRIPLPGPDEIRTFLAGQLGSPKPPPRDPPQRDAPDGDGAPSAADGPVGDTPAATASPDAEDAVADAGTDGAVVPATVVAPDAGVPFTYAEQQAFELFVAFLRPNPRHLKRLVNVYRLVRSLARAHGEALVLERPAATIRWLTMWSQWPYASLAMMDRFDAQMEAWNGVIPEDERKLDALPRLLELVGPELGSAARGLIDDDADELRQLLAIEGCGLTWAEIPRIRRYTVNFNPAIEERARLTPGAVDAAAGPS